MAILDWLVLIEVDKNDLARRAGAPLDARTACSPNTKTLPTSRATALGAQGYCNHFTSTRADYLPLA